MRCLQEWDIDPDFWLRLYPPHRHALIEAMTSRKTSLYILRAFNDAAEAAINRQR